MIKWLRLPPHVAFAAIALFACAVVRADEFFTGKPHSGWWFVVAAASVSYN